MPIRLRRLAIPLLAVLVAACSSTPPEPEAKSYPRITAERVKLQRLWKVSVGDGQDGTQVRLTPAVSSQHVAAASHDGLLMLIDRESGKLQWKKKTRLPITAGPAMGYGLVAIGTAKGELVLYSQADGSEKWRASLGAPVLAAPAIAADRVVALAGDGVVHALALADGAVRWTYNTSVPPLTLNTNAAPLLADDRVYIATSGGKLIRLDPETGAAEWEVRIATNSGRSELERMNDVVGNLLRVGERELYSVGFQSQLTMTDVEAGRRRWQYELSSVNDPAEGLGNIYVTDVEGFVLAVDRASGKLAWKQPDYAYRQLSNPVVLNNLLAVADDDGRVHLLSQSDGAVRGRVRASGDAVVALVVRDDVLYAWDDDGGLSAWKLR
jgi:outer membrane protein assembly factor BamB